MTEECYFCREDADRALDEHHVVPKRIVGNDEDVEAGVVSRTETLCSNCHRKLHGILDPAIEYTAERYRKRMEAGTESAGFTTASDL